nr:NADH dehydrogenase subunit 4L [Oxylipeurus chiniri]
MTVEFLFSFFLAFLKIFFSLTVMGSLVCFELISASLFGLLSLNSGFSNVVVLLIFFLTLVVIEGVVGVSVIVSINFECKKSLTNVTISSVS